MKNAFIFLWGAATATCYIGWFEWTIALRVPAIVSSIIIAMLVLFYIADHWDD
jgi:hypothetical protein